METCEQVRVERENQTAVREVEGQLSGYAVTWAYSDDGIQFQRGAFSKTIAERAGEDSKIPLLVRHDMDGSSLFTTVGWVRSGTEDDTGLMIQADFLADEFSQEIRARAMNDGIRGLSVNAKSIKGSRGPDGILQSTEALLREVSLTNIPKDPDSEITAVRGEESEGTTPEEEPAEATPAEEPEPEEEEEPPDGTPEELEAQRADLLREVAISLVEVE